MLPAMKRFLSYWRVLCKGRQDEVVVMRVLALMSFLAILSALLGSEFHLDFLQGFCTGLALAFSAVLALQLFSAKSVESKDDDDASRITELHLSR